MKFLIALLLLAACSPGQILGPKETKFSIDKKDVITIEGVLDADAPASAKEYKNAISIAVQ